MPLLIPKIKHNFERSKKDCLLAIACFQKTSELLPFVKNDCKTFWDVTLNLHIQKQLKKTRNLMKKFKKCSKNYCRKEQRLLNVIQSSRIFSNFFCSGRTAHSVRWSNDRRRSSACQCDRRHELEKLTWFRTHTAAYNTHLLHSFQELNTTLKNHFCLRQIFQKMAALKRLMAEHRQLMRNPPEALVAGPKTDDNYFEWDALIMGPEATPFEYG